MVGSNRFKVKSAVSGRARCDGGSRLTSAPGKHWKALCHTRIRALSLRLREPRRHMKAKPAKKKPPNKKLPVAADGLLKGWTAIACYLGIPVTTAHRWANEGMPVRREGRFTVADREAVSAWLGRESHMPKPAHVMTQDADMAAALKESIAE